MPQVSARQRSPPPANICVNLNLSFEDNHGPKLTLLHVPEAISGQYAEALPPQVGVALALFQQEACAACAVVVAQVGKVLRPNAVAALVVGGLGATRVLIRWVGVHWRKKNQSWY